MRRHLSRWPARLAPHLLYLIPELPSDLQSADVIAITLMALVLSFVATLYPSWAAARTNPAEALRYE